MAANSSFFVGHLTFLSSILDSLRNCFAISMRSKTVGLLPASIAAIGTLMVPVIGVYSSYLILDEKVSIADLLALLLVLSALVLVLLIPAWKTRRTARRS